jgi:hypothetical protein
MFPLCALAMATQDDLVVQVFSDERCRSPVSVAVSCRISERSKNYLVGVGLPREPYLGIYFNMLDQLPFLAEKLGSRRDPKSWTGSLRCLSFESDAAVCFDEDDNGSVWDIAPLISRRRDFMNSSIEQLGWFLARYVLYGRTPRAPTETEGERLRIVQEVERDMRNVDPRAMEDLYRFWPTVIGEMMNDMLP